MIDHADSLVPQRDGRFDRDVPVKDFCVGSAEPELGGADEHRSVAGGAARTNAAADRRHFGEGCLSGFLQLNCSHGD